jgi:hypothetical protein
VPGPKTRTAMSATCRKPLFSICRPRSEWLTPSDLLGLPHEFADMVSGGSVATVAIAGAAVNLPLTACQLGALYVGKAAF